MTQVTIRLLAYDDPVASGLSRLSVWTVPSRDETFPPCRGSTPFASREDFRRQDVKSREQHYHHYARQYARLRASSQVLGHEITQHANKEILKKKEKKKQKAAIWSISFIKLTHKYTTLTRVFASCRPVQLNRVHGAHSFILRQNGQAALSPEVFVLEGAFVPLEGKSHSIILQRRVLTLV